MASKLFVVIPCYNEEEVLPETSKRLVKKMADLEQKGLITPQNTLYNHTIPQPLAAAHLFSSL